MANFLWFSARVKLETVYCFKAAFALSRIAIFTFARAHVKFTRVNVEVMDEK